MVFPFVHFQVWFYSAISCCGESKTILIGVNILCMAPSDRNRHHSRWFRTSLNTEQVPSAISIQTSISFMTPKLKQAARGLSRPFPENDIVQYHQKGMWVGRTRKDHGLILLFTVEFALQRHIVLRREMQKPCARRSKCRAWRSRYFETKGNEAKLAFVHLFTGGLKKKIESVRFYNLSYPFSVQGRSGVIPIRKKPKIGATQTISPERDGHPSATLPFSRRIELGRPARRNGLKKQVMKALVM